MRVGKLSHNKKSFNWKIINSELKDAKMLCEMTFYDALLVHCVCLYLCRIMQKALNCIRANLVDSCNVNFYLGLRM